jgi:glycosyltransferase involved in cell wall biosynthesis
VFPTLAVGRAAMRTGVPLVYHQRGVFDPARLDYKAVKKRLYLNLIERPHLEYASRLFALTEAEVASYRALNLAAPTVVVPNGVDLDHFSNQPNHQDLASLGIGHRDQIILFLGRLHPIKGVEPLLEAFLELSSRFPAARLVLAGPDELGLGASWLSKARSQGLGDRLLLPGTVSGRLKTSLLARADVFCLPSSAEGFSMAILEAMASSTALVISPGCHFPDVACHGCGLIVDPERVALRRALSEVLGDPARAAEMGRRGRALVASRYRWDDVTDKIEQTNREVLHGATRAPAPELI